MNWININDEQPNDDEMVLTYSPVYENIRNGHEMTYRILRGSFAVMDDNITEWTRLTPPTR